MNSDALGMNAGGELAPVLSTIAGRANRRPAVISRAATPRIRALVDAAAAAGASASHAMEAIESSPVMPKATAQPGMKTLRNGARMTQAQLDARAQQREEDDDLIREAQRGDRSSFDALVRRYDQAVLRLALHMLGNEQDAQDIHQEAFLKAYRHLGNFRFECSFYTWLYRIVTNLCLDQLRRRKSRREDPSTVVDSQGDEMDLLSNVSDNRAMANPARELERKHMGLCISQALDKLTPRERMVFELKHYQGLKLRTIGELLSTTEETAKNTLFRATRKLRANLAELRESKA
ncbi:MAG TPA: RNA polymerase sigma factor [Acidobacteriaceae bacterium]|nr:RNA polymerase sigma factor [Acidobacteriaceae bacterium]